MIIADTNLISYLYFENAFSEEVSTVHECDPEWASPVLWRSEFVNVVALYLRKKVISYADGLEAIDFAQRTIANREFSVSPYTVLDLVRTSGCSAYDCEFIALAKEFGRPLITYDKKILREFPGVAMDASEFIRQNQK